jgi:hypothetical protein
MTGSLRMTGSIATFSTNCFGIGTTTPLAYNNYVALTVGDNSTTKTGLIKLRSCYNSGDGAEIYQTTAGILTIATNGSDSALRIFCNNVASFTCQVCAPGMDIMPSGIGVSTLGGIMRVVTTGTSTGIAVGQSNSNRYTHIAANDIQVFNDDFFLSTRCAFPLSIGTCYTARLTFAATGIACFACQICTTSAALSGNIIFNRASTSAGNNIEWRTANTLNWYIGTRGLVNNNFYFVNEGLGANNLILDAASGVATFACNVTVNSTITAAQSTAETSAIVASSGWSGTINNPIITFGRVALAVAGQIGYDDPNTGLYIGTCTNHRLAIRTNNTDRLVISNTGIATFACQVCAPAGVKFGNGSSTLNYYQEGTFTPTFGTGGDTSGMVYATRSGSYTKVGNLVNVRVFIGLTTLGGSTGNAYIYDLPFTNGQAVAVVGSSVIFNAGAAFTNPSIILIGSQNYAGLFKNNAGNAITKADLTNTTEVYFNVTYQV